MILHTSCHFPALAAGLLKKADQSACNMEKSIEGNRSLVE